MFQVTTLDLNNVPKTEDGKVDFSQDFYGKPTNLTVSGQLNGETFAMAFRNIYTFGPTTFGPTFRAENSNTTRHAAEFWMIEPEIAFADLDDAMRLAEDMIKYIISYVMEHAPEEMAFFNQFVDKGLMDRLNNVLHNDFGRITYTEAIKYIISYVMEHAPEEMAFFNQFVDKGLMDRLNNVLHNDFGRITYTEAVALLEQHNDQFEYPVHWGSDLQTEHERYLTEVVFKKPVFVTDYPKDIKAFYMKLNPDGKTVAAMDCLVPGIGEIIGGSQREDDYDILKNRIEELGMNPEDYGFYLDLRKYGSARHAGFGLGFERCVMYLTGMGNIRRIEELGMNPEDYGFYLDLRKYGSARHAGFGLGFERCVMYLTGMGNIRDVLPFPRTVGNCEL